MTDQSPSATPADHRLAADLAAKAGRLLVELRDAEPNASVDELRRQGDRRSHELLVEALGESRPDDAVLSEEGADDDARLAAERVWIIDPLDGTREFGERRDDWAVHVALVVGGQPVAGAVALPGRNLTLSTAEPPSVPPGEEGIRVLISRTRRPPPVLALAEALGAELVELGSAGAKTMAVVLGDGDVYAHTGGQYEWDSCAPVAVAAAAGLHTSRFDGSPLAYNRPDPRLPDLLVCRADLAERILELTPSLADG